MREKKSKPPIVDIMTLEFFATHFNFPVASLQWGVVEMDGNGYIGLRYVAVLITDKPLLFIDIMRCKIRQCVNTSRASFKLYPCEMEESEGKFYFFHETNILDYFDKEAINEAYCDQVYSAATDRYLLGGFADFLP